MKCRPLWITAAFAAAALLMPSINGKAAPPAAVQDADAIVVTRVSDVPGAWKITLPPKQFATLTDQAWLVVDGQQSGLGGGYFVPRATHNPLTIYANINSDLDGQVKDILKAQGLPVKDAVTVYHISYGINFPAQITQSQALTFAHSTFGTIYSQLPEKSVYKVGDRIPLFDAVALDSSAIGKDVFDHADPTHQTHIPMPTDQLHHLRIEVQFLPMPKPPKTPAK